MNFITEISLVRCVVLRAAFSKINSNSLHILQQFMPERPSSNYSLWVRPHNKPLIAKTTQLNDQDFIIRSIYKDLYWLYSRHIQHASLLALFCYVCISDSLCISTIVLIIAYVNLILKKMMMMMMMITTHTLQYYHYKTCRYTQVCLHVCFLSF